MSVSNGQTANQSTFNGAFVSKTSSDEQSMAATLKLSAGNLKRFTANGLTAFATGGQGSATALTADFNVVATCATAADSVKLPVGTAGMAIWVFNRGAANLAVFPASSEQIDALGANISMTVHPGSDFQFICKADGIWVTAKNDQPLIQGTRASGIAVTTAGITALARTREEIIFTTCAGVVDVSANPQISAGTMIGQKLLIVHRHATNTLLLQDSDGLAINGDCLMALNSTLELMWEGTVWLETGRN